MVFFSKNKKTATARVSKLSSTDNSYKNVKPVLSNKQIPHSSGWKTWSLKKKMRK